VSQTCRGCPGSVSRESDIRILLVEDDQEIAERLASGLAQTGYVVDRAANGRDGYELGCSEQYAAAILDLGLPDMQGLDILRRWRAARRDLPVLILTARGTWSEKVDGLNAGADDYVTKPFHIPEVAARLRALIRRRAGVASPVLEHKGVRVDTAAGRVTFEGRDVELTALELRMLVYFLHRVGRIVSQGELTEHLYPLEQTRESNTIEVYVSRLRRKLGSRIIKTVRGLGYRME
jgi:DNA-binding response OmpR family regulator